MAGDNTISAQGNVQELNIYPLHSIKSEDKEPPSGFMLGSFINGVKKTFDETFPNFSMDKVLDVLTNIAKVVGVILIGAVVLASVPLWPIIGALGTLGEVAVAAVMIVVLIVRGGIDAGLYVADKVYGACNPESGHGMQWSNAFSEMCEPYV